MCYLFSMIPDGLRAISEISVYIYIYKQKKQTLHLTQINVQLRLAYDNQS